MKRALIADLPSGVGVSESKNGRGRKFFRVRLGKRFTGGHIVKKDFDKLADAREWIFGPALQDKASPGPMVSLKKQAGAAAFELSAARITEATAAFRQLGDLGTLTEAVAYFVKHAKPSGGIYSVSEAIEALIDDKRAAGKGERHLKGMKWNLERFSDDFPKALLHQIKRDQIESWLLEEDFGITTRGNYLRDLSILFNFALKREWVASNPLVGISKPNPSNAEIEILTPEATQEFLWVAEELQPEIVAPLAIKFFAGLRTSELFALDWSLVDMSQITILAKSAKTRKRRMVTVSENLRAWLTQYGAKSGPVTPHTHNAWHRRLEVIEAAVAERLAESQDLNDKEPFQVPPNGARHSFCSYHYALHRNENSTAAEAGNSPAVIFSNYRVLLNADVAKRYWSILPKKGGTPITDDHPVL